MDDSRCVVLVPCYNEPSERIAATVATALATPGVDLVRVIDDGSTALFNVPVDARVELLRLETNAGPSAALNAGLADLSDDDIVCRLDVGDAYYPEPKARQISEVRGGVLASASPYWDPVRNTVREVAPDWRRRIYRDCQFSTVTAVYRRSVWGEIGGFAGHLRWCEDWLFTMRVQSAIGWHIFQEVTCSAAEYPGGHTDVSASPRRKAERDANYAEVAKIGMAYANPSQFKHLFDERWCRKRGVRPLVKP